MNLQKIFCGLKFIIYLAEMFFLYSAERFLIFKVGSFTVSVLLVVSLVVFVALFEGEIFGFCFAFLGGFFLDFGFGVPVGIYASLMGLIGYAFGVLSNCFINVNFLTAWLFSGFTGFLVLILRLFSNYGGFGFWDVLTIGFNVYLPMIICTFLAAPFIILFNRLIFYYAWRQRGDSR